LACTVPTKLNQEEGCHMKSKVDLNNFNQQLIITGMIGLIDDGLTFHEMMDVLEDIKRDTFPAMMQLSREKKVTV
jgi:hypothetical protein